MLAHPRQFIGELFSCFVPRNQGPDCTYSVEENGIHVYENLAEMESISWSIRVLDEVWLISRSRNLFFLMTALCHSSCYGGDTDLFHAGIRAILPDNWHGTADNELYN